MLMDDLDDHYHESSLGDDKDFFNKKTVSYTKPMNPKTHNKERNVICINNLVGLLKIHFGHYNSLNMEHKIFDVMLSLSLKNISVVNHENAELEIVIDSSAVYFPNARMLDSTALLLESYDLDHSVYNNDGKLINIFESITQDLKHADFLKFLKEHVNHIDDNMLRYRMSELCDAHQNYSDMIEVVGNVL